MRNWLDIINDDDAEALGEYIDAHPPGHIYGLDGFVLMGPRCMTLIMERGMDLSTVQIIDVCTHGGEWESLIVVARHRPQAVAVVDVLATLMDTVIPSAALRTVLDAINLDDDLIYDVVWAVYQLNDSVVNAHRPLIILLDRYRNIDRVNIPFVNGAPRPGITPLLHLFARDGDVMLVQRMLDLGVDAAARDRHGRQAWHVASDDCVALLKEAAAG